MSKFLRKKTRILYLLINSLPLNPEPAFPDIPKTREMSGNVGEMSDVGRCWEISDSDLEVALVIGTIKRILFY